jgi:hypothetical protein
MRVIVTASAVVLATLALAAPALAGTSCPPIPPSIATVLPDFAGAAATPQPVTVSIRQNHSLASNPFSYLHNDSGDSDVFSAWAPLGSDPQVSSSTLGAGSGQAIGSAYWYLDLQDRVTMVSGTDKIMTVCEGGTLSQPRSTWCRAGSTTSPPSTPRPSRTATS